jgi:hypothetical protein
MVTQWGYRLALSAHCSTPKSLYLAGNGVVRNASSVPVVTSDHLFQQKHLLWCMTHPTTVCWSSREDSHYLVLH